MTKKDKELLAGAVINHVANLFEDWEMVTTEGFHSDIAHLDLNEARKVVAGWMKKLPGKMWDRRLGPA